MKHTLPSHQKREVLTQNQLQDWEIEVVFNKEHSRNVLHGRDCFHWWFSSSGYQSTQIEWLFSSRGSNNKNNSFVKEILCWEVTLRDCPGLPVELFALNEQKYKHWSFIGCFVCLQRQSGYKFDLFSQSSCMSWGESLKSSNHNFSMENIARSPHWWKIMYEPVNFGPESSDQWKSDWCCCEDLVPGAWLIWSCFCL